MKSIQPPVSFIRFIAFFIAFIIPSLHVNGQASILWSSSGGSAWLTNTNWTGNVVPTATDIAQIGVNPTGSGGVGINMNGTTNNGSQNQSVGAIEMTSARTSGNPVVGNSSTTKSGTLTLTGATVNSVANVILRNNSSKDLTIQNVQGSGNLLMNIALANATDNKIFQDASGKIIISSIIMGASNCPMTVTGGGSSEVDITGTANTFSGSINLLGSETVFSADGSLGAVPGSVKSNAIVIDGGRFTTASPGFSININRGIQVSNAVGTSISVKSAGSISIYNGVIADKPSTTGSWAKQGAGTLQLGGISTYSGGTAINNGILQLINGSNRLPLATTLSLGQAASANTGTLDLNGFSQQVNGVNSITGLTIATKNTITSAASGTLLISSASNFTYGVGTTTNSGIITGLVNVEKAGSGIQTLGDINSYTGSTIIDAGELRFSPNANENLGSSAVTLNGGTLGTSGITNNIKLSFSTLNLNDNSTIALDASATHTINFANSNSTGWASSKTLTITGWQGTYTTSAGSAGTNGRVFVGTSASALTAAQLSQISFFNGTNYYGATLLSSGELVPYCISPVITMVSNSGPVCEGSSLSFSVTATGTATPVFLWSGPNSFSSTSQNPVIAAASAAANGPYSVTASNGCGSVAISTIAAVVNATVAPSLTISTTNTSVCSGTSVTFSAVTANGGTSPSFQWKVNNVNAGTNSSAFITSALANNDKVLCVLTSNAACPNPASVNSNTITMAVTTTPSITAVASQSVCGGKTIAAIIFTTVPSGQGVFWTNSNTSIGLNPSGAGNIATYTAPVVSTDQTGNIAAIPFTGSCFGISTNFNITIKGAQPSTVWTGSVSSDWFNPDNWSNCVCGSSSTATIAAVATSPLISGTNTAEAGTLTIDPGASLSIQNTQTLNIYGDWIDNGTFNAQQGSVVLTGTVSQNISGSSSTAFYNLSLNNSSGASMTTAQSVSGSLLLNSGSLNTNNFLTLAANASSAGKIGPINAAADIIGNVTVQQYAPGGYTGWALLGAPITSALSMADWNDNFAITCASCPDGFYGNFTSIYSYDETAAGSYSSTAKYIPINAITDNIIPAAGYWVYLGNGSVSTSAIMFDVTGTVAKSSCLSCSGPVTIPVSFTSNNGPTDDGWNLVSNPLPSPISWTALRNGNTNVDNGIYIFNADLSGGSGAFTSYVNNVSSDPIGSGGIDDNIPMCQGFYIHATASTNLVAGENIKVNTNPTFLRTSSTTASNVKPIVRLVLNGPSNSKDMATFYFDNGGSTAFQTDFDTYKLLNDPTVPYLASLSGTVETSINGLPTLTANISVPVKASTGSSGSFYFSLLSSNFPPNVCVNLYDIYTGITTNLLASTYSCNLYDTTQTARFSISFGTTPLAGTASMVQPSCASPNGGSIIAAAGSAGPWDYTWTNASNIIVKTVSSKNGPDTLSTLSGGNYTVKINTTGQCDNFSQALTINAVSLPVAQFSPASFTVNAGSGLNFINSSTNSSNFNWDFGDSFGTSTAPNPVYSYAAGGNYTVTLIASSSSACTDTSKSVITVLSALGITESGKRDDILLKTLGADKYVVSLNLEKTERINWRLMDVSGKIHEQQQTAISNGDLPFDLSGYAGGIYLLQLQTGDKSTTFRLVKGN